MLKTNDSPAAEWLDTDLCMQRLPAIPMFGFDNVCFVLNEGNQIQAKMVPPKAPPEAAHFLSNVMCVWWHLWIPSWPRMARASKECWLIFQASIKFLKWEYSMDCRRGRLPEPPAVCDLCGWHTGNPQANSNHFASWHTSEAAGWMGCNKCGYAEVCQDCLTPVALPPVDGAGGHLCRICHQASPQHVVAERFRCLVMDCSDVITLRGLNQYKGLFNSPPAPVDNSVDYTLAVPTTPRGLFNNPHFANTGYWCFRVWRRWTIESKGRCLNTRWGSSLTGEPGEQPNPASRWQQYVSRWPSILPESPTRSRACPR